MRAESASSVCALTDRLENGPGRGADRERHARIHRAADNSDEIVLSPHRKSAATRLKLELELSPAEAAEGAAEGPLTYSEWDWRRRAYRETYVRVWAATAREDGPEWKPAPETLRRIRRVRKQFETFRPHRETARHRLLLTLTDGKPNDIDHYEGRFELEDTRRAIGEARRKHIRVFGVTIDARA